MREPAAIIKTTGWPDTFALMTVSRPRANLLHCACVVIFVKDFSSYTRCISE